MAEQKQNKVFVLSDVHGNIALLNKLLEYWNPQEEQLIILGDLGDRGPDSKACFQKTKELMEEQRAICLRGNHEEMLLDFLKRPEETGALYYLNGGIQTLASFLELEEEDVFKYSVEELAAGMRSKEPWLIPFIENLPLKYEWGNYVFVHAGVDLTLPDWRKSSNRDFVWIREGFLDQKNSHEEIFVFGHTPTLSLNEKSGDSSIWESGDGKIGIDGGAVFGGSLNALVISNDGIEQTHSVRYE